MISMKKLWKKLTCSFFAALGMGTLVSCYGMPPNGFYTCVYGTVTDSSQNAVRGIKVTVKNNDTRSVDTTDEQGKYFIEFFAKQTEPLDYIIEFQDIDGDENGNFKLKTERIDFYNQDSLQKDIALEENQ